MATGMPPRTRVADSRRMLHRLIRHIRLVFGMGWGGLPSGNEQVAPSKLEHITGPSDEDALEHRVRVNDMPRHDCLLDVEGRVHP